LVLLDFLVFELGDSLVVASVLVDSLAGSFSAFVSDFFVLFELLLVDGLEALSAAGLFVVAGDLVVDDFDEGDGLIAGTGLGFTVEAGVVVAATEAVAAGVIVAAAVAAGLALAFVEADVLVVVFGAVVVVPVVVVPVVVDALTPKVAGTLTP